MYTTKDIYMYIFSWKKTTENVKTVYKNVIDHFPNTTILNCDETENFLAKEIQLDDSYSYGGLFQIAIRDVPPGKILSIMVGDVCPDADWSTIADRSIHALNTGNIGIYTPNINMRQTKKYKSLGDDIWEVKTIDCMCWFIDPSIVSRVSSIPYRQLANLGWGMDTMCIEESNKVNKYAVCDYRVTLQQPEGSVYSYIEAHKQGTVLSHLYASMSKKIVFSFSLWGTSPKYTEGMIQNAKQIGQRFPTATVHIYMANDVPVDIQTRLAAFPNVKIIPSVKQEGALNMFDRFTAIDDDTCDIMFVRDADSRVHDRDAGCIYDFLASDTTLHIIRDHYHHKFRIMGGMWGLRKYNGMPSIQSRIDTWRKANPHRTAYCCDQHFLNEVIYPAYTHTMLVHDRNTTVPGEIRTPFAVPIVDDLFVGQVFIYKDGKEVVDFKA